MFPKFKGKKVAFKCCSLCYVTSVLSSSAGGRSIHGRLIAYELNESSKLHGNEFCGTLARCGVARGRLQGKLTPANTNV